MIPTDEQLRMLSAVADTLIPGDDHRPGAASAVTGDALTRVLDTRADLYAPLCRVLDELADIGLDALDQTLRLLWTDRPQDFEALSTAVAGAYYLQPEVRRAIGYEGPVRHLTLGSPEDTAAALGTVAPPLSRSGD